MSAGFGDRERSGADAGSPAATGNSTNPGSSWQPSLSPAVPGTL